jgi:hypothetical protein
MKDKKELEGLLTEGALTDLWKVSFKGKEVETEDGWVLEDRRGDEKADVEAEGGWTAEEYSVVIKRKLTTGDDRDVQLNQGDTVDISIAVHDDRMGGRKHYVSFPISVGLGTDGDIKAEKF